MNVTEIIRARRSVRTFDGRAVTPEDREKLEEYVASIGNPYEIPVEFVFLDAKEQGLSSPVIQGAPLFVAAKVERVLHAEEAFGFSFEKLVLYAWSLGIGTTWIGGTMNRTQFEKAAGLEENRKMFCMSPLGYPAKRMAIKEAAMRKMVKADSRKPFGELFFDGDFQTPLTECAPEIREALEMVRLAPSAVNMQPWRIVREEDRFHFYLKRNKGYAGGSSDLQKVDMGIALCHFLCMTEGRLVLEDPGKATGKDMEYIATVAV